MEDSAVESPLILLLSAVVMVFVFAPNGARANPPTGFAACSPDDEHLVQRRFTEQKSRQVGRVQRVVRRLRGCVSGETGKDSSARIGNLESDAISEDANLAVSSRPVRRRASPAF
jgi:hypothetical protein